MRAIRSGRTLGALALGVMLASAGSAQAQTKTAGDKVPVTTASEEARQLYLKGRDKAEKLDNSEGRIHYEKAVAKDPSFALAYVGLAQTSLSTKQFFDSVGKAVANAAKVSEGERLIIKALEAGSTGNNGVQRESLTKLTQMFPSDERVFNAYGLFLFGQQEYEPAIASFQKAISINPQFSQPYNMMGYAHRFMERYTEAEKAFKAYVALIPNDPNPHDSYAELLMKMGRYDESIKTYRKALAIQDNFLASYIGIGHAQMFQGKGDEARATFAKMQSLARNDGEKRQAMFWIAMSHVYEGAHHKAMAELERRQAIAEINGDTATAAQDLTLMGNVLLDAGRTDEALRRYTASLKLTEGSPLPADAKAAAKRQLSFNEARVAIAKNDVATARTKAAEFARAVAVRKNPFEVRQTHELEGRIALLQKDHARAVAELKKANQQDPQVLYLQALAVEGAGDAAAAAQAWKRVTTFNGLNPNYSFVRAKAKAKAGTAKG